MNARMSFEIQAANQDEDGIRGGRAKKEFEVWDDPRHLLTANI